VATFTGERPGRAAGYEYDHSRHQVAYRAVGDLVAGKVVVDAGAGDGAGTAMLARRAARVIGLDYHEASVARARRDHGGPRIEFRVADLGDAWPVEGADVAVAFQIIEHFEDDDGFVRRALEAVRPGGVVVMTTPNRLRSFSENPYHVREYTGDELRELLGRHSSDVDLKGVFGNAKVTAFDERRKAEVDRWLRLDPLRLRDRLPRRVVEAAFATLSTAVRRRASGSRRRPHDPITTDDFELRDGDLDGCLDLFAVVRTAPPGRGVPVTS
jgi:SAM-dependent methyltransferase